MALHTEWSEKNRLIENDLAVRYQMRGKKLSFEYYECVRRATKDYRYIGMTHDAAKRCEAAMLAKYTRWYKFDIVEDEKWMSRSGSDPIWWREPSILRGIECQTEIACHHDEGDNWFVEVHVNETDYEWSRTLPDDPAKVFSAENARDYDDGDQILKITKANRVVSGQSTFNIELDWVNNIESPIVGALALEYKLSPTASEWIAVGDRFHWYDKLWIACLSPTEAPDLILRLNYNNGQHISESFFVYDAPIPPESTYGE